MCVCVYVCVCVLLIFCCYFHPHQHTVPIGGNVTEFVEAACDKYKIFPVFLTGSLEEALLEAERACEFLFTHFIDAFS